MLSLQCQQTQTQRPFGHTGFVYACICNDDANLSAERFPDRLNLCRSCVGRCRQVRSPACLGRPCGRQIWTRRTGLWHRRPASAPPQRPSQTCQIGQSYLRSFVSRSSIRHLCHSHKYIGGLKKHGGLARNFWGCARMPHEQGVLSLVERSQRFLDPLSPTSLGQFQGSSRENSNPGHRNVRIWAQAHKLQMAYLATRAHCFWHLMISPKPCS